MMSTCWSFLWILGFNQQKPFGGSKCLSEKAWVVWVIGSMYGKVGDKLVYLPTFGCFFNVKCRFKKHSMDPYGQLGMKPTLKHPNSPPKK